MQKIDVKKCLNCNKIIDWYSDEYSHLHISIFKRKKFCNLSCSNTYTKKVENRNDKDNSILRVKNCKGCGNEINWFNGFRKTPLSTFLKMKYCSKECSDIYGFRYTGENHPNFKQNARRKNRRGSAARWTKNVFKRDKYQCQKCGVKGENAILNAHHIKPVSKFPDLKWILDNGMTLCIDCHHNEHGYQKFNGDSIISEHKNIRSIRVKKKCSSCNEDLYIEPSGLRIYSGKKKGSLKKNFYCNKSCMSNHYKIIRVGKGNPRSKHFN